MKTVIVVDSEDPIGMENTRRIVDQLLISYHDSNGLATGHPFSGKIRFIKTVRAYVSELKHKYPNDWQERIGSLKSVKYFADTLPIFRSNWPGHE